MKKHGAHRTDAVGSPSIVRVLFEVGLDLRQPGPGPGGATVPLHPHAEKPKAGGFCGGSPNPESPAWLHGGRRRQGR